MYEEVLRDVGLSTNEARVYTALLSLGSTTITTIAKRAKLHRSNVYDAIEKLVHKGLVSYISKDQAHHYEACDPKILLDMLREREQRLNAILPELLLQRKLAESKGQAHIYEGVGAFVKLLYQLLELKAPILVYGIPKRAPELMRTRIPHFHKERIKREIPMKHIYNYTARERINYLNTIPFTEARYLNQKIRSEAHTLICGDRVIITMWADPVVTVEIINVQLAESYIQYFSLLWESAKV